MTVKHLFPAVEPSLNLDFANSKKLDPRITFTRSSTGTYVDSNGLIKTAAANEARFDHDPVSGSSLGLLVEESRTNLITYSEEFNNSFWTTVNSSVTVNSATSPDGTLTADKLVENTSNNYHNIVSDYATVDDPSFSCYVKAAGRNFVNLRLYYPGGGGSRVWATFSLVDGSVTDQGKINTFFTNESVKSESLGNSWFRLTLSANTASAQSILGALEISNAAVPASRTNGAPVYTGDGTSGIYVWGAQLEAGSFPTSYIPTSGSTVTRSADVANITGTNLSSWYTPNENTVFWEASTTDTSTNTKPVYVLIDSTKSSTINSTVTGARTAYYVGDTNYIQIAARTPQNTRRTYPSDSNYNPVGQTNKVAHAYSGSSDVGAAINGADPSYTASASLNPGTVDTMWIGRNENLSPDIYLNGHITRLTHYPYRLTDAQLQALTL